MTQAPGNEMVRPDDERILRFRPGQRYVHLLVATSFVALFLSGLPLIFSPLHFLAAGGWSRILHRVAAVGFMAVPVLYVIVDGRGAKELITDSFHFDRDDRAWLAHMGRYVLGNATGMPPQGRLNAGQKLHHAAVMVLGVGIVGSGLLLWFAKSSLSASMLAWTLVIHDVLDGLAGAAARRPHLLHGRLPGDLGHAHGLRTEGGRADRTREVGGGDRGRGRGGGSGRRGSGSTGHAMTTR